MNEKDVLQELVNYVANADKKFQTELLANMEKYLRDKMCKYRPRFATVDAICVIDESAATQFLRTHIKLLKRYVCTTNLETYYPKSIKIEIETLNDQTFIARYGDWIVKVEDTILVYSNKEFVKLYEKIL